MTTKRQDQALSAYLTTLEYFEKSTHVFPGEIPDIVKRLEATAREIDKLRGLEKNIRLEATLKMLEVPLHAMREDHMLPLSRMSRRVFKGESALLAAIRVPHKRATAEVMIAAALRMVETLSPHRRVLKQSRIDPARVTLLKAKAKSLDKLARKTAALAADSGVPSNRFKELFASAHEDISSLQALVKACRHLSSGEQAHFAGCTRIGKMRGRPSKRRQRNAERKKGA